MSAPAGRGQAQRRVSLGVLLYELLTGTTPGGAGAGGHSTKKRWQGSTRESRGSSRGGAPRPSTRISTWRHAHGRVGQEETDPRKLSTISAASWIWIVMGRRRRTRPPTDAMGFART